jgi:hypothetical protein
VALYELVWFTLDGRRLGLQPSLTAHQTLSRVKPETLFLGRITPSNPDTV